jgi:hypothetical protein
VILLTRDEKDEAIRLLGELEHIAARRAGDYPDSNVRAHEYLTVRKLEDVVRHLATTV